MIVSSDDFNEDRFYTLCPWLSKRDRYLLENIRPSSWHFPEELPNLVLRSEEPHTRDIF